VCFLVVSGALLPAEAAAFCRSSSCKGDACERDADGCVQGGLPLFWAGGCVGFSLNGALTSRLAAAPVRAAVERSFQAWTGLACEGEGDGAGAGGASASIAFSELRDSRCATSGYAEGQPNLNLIVFRDLDFPYRGEDSTLARTTVTFDASTGEILDADIEVNAAFNELTVGDERVVYDLQSIMTHEIGHFMGIAHSSDAGATMRATYDTGSTGLRSLAPDDVAAACAIYPPTRQVGCDPLPLGGEQSCDPTPPDEGCSLSPGAAGAADRGRWASVRWGSLVVASAVLLVRRSVRRRASRSIVR
jgi:hypothetical protein